LPKEKKQFRVLVVRLGAMGDILHALPAVTALRQAHPEWFIGWAVEPQWRGLLCAGECKTRRSEMPLPEMPLVDQIHIVPAKQWARAPLRGETLRAIRTLRRELREARYDICIDLQGAVRSAIIGRWARASRLIGEDRPRERAARWFFRERVPTQGVHVIEQAIEVVNQAAGDSLPFIAALLPSNKEAENEAAKLSQPFVLLNPGAGWGAKRWPIDRYASVARHFCASGYGVIINAGPGEESIANELISLLSGVGNARMLQPTLSELIEITRKAALVIAGDTGPLHLASALGRPVVAIFGPTDPARNGPFGGSYRVLRHPESKRDHSRRAEPEAGLLTIAPETVIEAAEEILKESQ
jgi:heptosyltransferase-1